MKPGRTVMGVYLTGDFARGKLSLKEGICGIPSFDFAIRIAGPHVGGMLKSGSRNTQGRRLPIGVYGFAMLLIAAAGWVHAETPSPFETQFDAVAASGDAYGTSASVLSRYTLPMRGWYWGFGFQAEQFSFDGRGGRPRRLRDTAAVLKLEYFTKDGEPAAALALRPGWYFGERATGKSWDVPVELTSGVPIVRDLDGVVGFSNGRFYHHAVPIVGLVWAINPWLRLEAIYPEPAVVWTLDQRNSLRVGGELSGGGFLLEAPGDNRVVEYVSYRVGAAWTTKWRGGFETTLGAGVETNRDFDFFRQNQNQHESGAGYLRLSTAISW
jgi:hypothetical protein